MFPQRWFPGRFWTAWYFPKVGSAVPATVLTVVPAEHVGYSRLIREEVY